MVTTRFLETPQFTAEVIALRAEEGLRKLQLALASDPEAGDVLQGTGGFRKVRMALPGRGKSGGARVIYLFLPVRNRIVFFHVFTKNQSPNISDAGKAVLRKAAAELKAVEHLIP